MINTDRGHDWAWIGTHCACNRHTALTANLYWGESEDAMSLVQTKSFTGPKDTTFETMTNLVPKKTYYYKVEVTGAGKTIEEKGYVVTRSITTERVIVEHDARWVYISTYCNSKPAELIRADLFLGKEAGQLEWVHTKEIRGPGQLEFNTEKESVWKLSNLEPETQYYYTLELKTSSDTIRKSGMFKTKREAHVPLAMVNNFQTMTGHSWSWMGAYYDTNVNTTLTAEFYLGKSEQTMTLREAKSVVGPSMIKFNFSGLENETRYFYKMVTRTNGHFESEEDTQTGSVYTLPCFFDSSGVAIKKGRNWAWLGVSCNVEEGKINSTELHFAELGKTYEKIAETGPLPGNFVEFNGAKNPIIRLSELAPNTSYAFKIFVFSKGKRYEIHDSFTTHEVELDFLDDEWTIVKGKYWAYINGYCQTDSTETAEATLFLGTVQEQLTPIHSIQFTGAKLIEFHTETDQIPEMANLAPDTLYFFRVDVTSQRGTVSYESEFRTDPEDFMPLSIKDGEVVVEAGYYFARLTTLIETNYTNPVTARLYLGTSEDDLYEIVTENLPGGRKITFNSPEKEIDALMSLKPDTYYYYRIAVTSDNADMPESVSQNGAFRTQSGADVVCALSNENGVRVEPMHNGVEVTVDLETQPGEEVVCELQVARTGDSLQTVATKNRVNSGRLYFNTTVDATGDMANLTQETDYYYRISIRRSDGSVPIEKSGTFRTLPYVPLSLL